MHSQSGFTLVEALISIGILAVSVMVPISIVAQSFFAAQASRDQTTAVYLAQEGLEGVRNIRDTNVLSGLPWTTGLNGCFGVNGCQINVLGGTVTTCGSSGCDWLRLDEDDTWQYGYSGSWPVSIFRRHIYITQHVPGREIEVESVVSWQRGLFSKTISSSAFLYNWEN